MKINISMLAVSISLVIAASQTNASNQQIIDVNDVSSTSSNTKKCFALGCILKLGTFSSEKYANRYKQSIANKTNQPVKVERDPKNKNLFNVLVGPFNDLGKMLQTSATLTGKAVNTTYDKTKNSTNQILQPTSNNVQQNKTSSLRENLSKPIMNVKNLFKLKHNNSTQKTVVYNNKKRTIALSHPNGNYSTGSNHAPTMSKHDQILASQSDYPIHQKLKTDAKGNPIPLFKAGPYIGASAGVQSNVGKNPETLAYQAFSGTLSAGAGRMFTDRFYMAGEFYLNDNVRAKAFTANADAFSIYSGINYGGNFIPGYMITDTVLAYLRFGGMRALWESSPSNFNSSSRQIGRVSIIKNGWQIGAGTQTNLYKNLDGRADYIYTQFQGLAFSNKARANINQVNIGLVYKFTDVLRRA